MVLLALQLLAAAVAAPTVTRQTECSSRLFHDTNNFEVYSSTKKLPGPEQGVLWQLARRRTNTSATSRAFEPCRGCATTRSWSATRTPCASAARGIGSALEAALHDPAQLKQRAALVVERRKELGRDAARRRQQGRAAADGRGNCGGVPQRLTVIYSLHALGLFPAAWVAIALEKLHGSGHSRTVLPRTTFSAPARIPKPSTIPLAQPTTSFALSVL